MEQAWYDPWLHADDLGATICYRDDIPRGISGAYLNGVIYLRRRLPRALERCILAHEIVHYEHDDRGYYPMSEYRADRIAARRLIDYDGFVASVRRGSDLGRIARDLGVPVRLLVVWVRSLGVCEKGSVFEHLIRY